MADIIDRFNGDYYFLSNYYLCLYGLVVDGIRYTNSEAAFQAAKTINKKERLLKFAPAGATTAKIRGRRIDLRPDWEEVKDDVMYQVVKAKFTQNRDLMDSLIDTGDAYLIEGNTWHDNYWGICTCNKCLDIPGQNKTWPNINES